MQIFLLLSELPSDIHGKEVEFVFLVVEVVHRGDHTRLERTGTGRSCPASNRGSALRSGSLSGTGSRARPWLIGQKHWQHVRQRQPNRSELTVAKYSELLNMPRARLREDRSLTVAARYYEALLFFP